MAQRKRRLFQFSLGTLLLLTTVAAMLCAWVGQRIVPYREQAAIRDLLTERGYHVNVTPASRDLDLRFGEFITGEKFFTVTGLFNCGRRDLDLSDLPAALDLRSLHLSGAHVTDDTLANLPPMPHLQSLALWHCEVTDKALEKLDRFPALEELQPCNTKMTYQGWADLHARTPRIVVDHGDQVAWEVRQAGEEGLANARKEADRRRKLQLERMMQLELESEENPDDFHLGLKQAMREDLREPIASTQLADLTELCPRDNSPAAQERYKTIPAGKLGRVGPR